MMTGEASIGDVALDGGWDGPARVAAITARSANRGRWIVDDDPAPAFPLYTRANIGEVFPDVVQPLSWTLWGIPHAEIGWRIAFERLGAFDLSEFPQGAMAMLGVFNGYGYLNASASRVFGARTPGLGAAAIDASFFGEQPDVPPYVEGPNDASPVHAGKLGAMLGWLFSGPDLSDLDAMRAEIEAERAARPDLAALDDAALFAHVERLNAAHFRRLWVRHIMATYHSTIPAGVIAGIAAAVGEGARAADVLTSDQAADSAAPALALWELSRGPAVAAASPAFAAFIRAFGFRGPNEWEMRSRTWEIDPATPLAALAALRRAADAESPAARAAARAQAKAEAVAAIEAKLSGDPAALGQFQAAVAAAGRFFAARERTKTSCAMLVHEMRVAMWELGRRFTARGHLAAPDRFALLTVAEWHAALRDPAFVRALTDARAAEEARLAALEPPFIVDGEAPPAGRLKRRAEPADHAGAGAVLRGAPGCAGVARGRARIVLDPGDPGDLGPDDILVAPHTDPSWTPLMASCAGVVVNVGATVSHAVIVARELGVPCAVSVTGATSRIPDGATIEVDGGAGTVRLL